MRICFSRYLHVRIVCELTMPINSTSSITHINACQCHKGAIYVSKNMILIYQLHMIIKQEVIDEGYFSVIMGHYG